MNDTNSGRGRKRGRSRGRSGGGAKASAAKGGARKPAPKVDPKEFWGDPDLLPERIEGLSYSPDVRAVLTSLGRPPMAGNETAAEHWFSMVYERAAFLAGALAAAGGLDRETESDT